MYAVIRTQGQQTTVREGELVDVNKLPGHIGSEVVFDDVLLVSDGDDIAVGRPTVAGAKVVGEIVSQFRGKKIRVYKFKRRKGYSRTQGHRQDYTKVRIKAITR